MLAPAAARKLAAVSRPLVSIVTPSYNQARWLEETIESVLAQDYPNIEYVIVEGGSTDGSADIVRRYEDRIAWWTSLPGSSQSAALNHGFEHASGDLLTWINSDDTLLPGAVSTLVAEFERDPELVLVYGDAIYTDEESRQTVPLSARSWDVPLMLRTFECHVVQPASIFTRTGWEVAGPLSEDRAWFFDFEFFMKLSQVGRAKQLHEPFATYRLHTASKSVGDRRWVRDRSSTLCHGPMHRASRTISHPVRVCHVVSTIRLPGM